MFVLRVNLTLRCRVSGADFVAEILTCGMGSVKRVKSEVPSAEWSVWSVEWSVWSLKLCGVVCVVRRVENNMWSME